MAAEDWSGSWSLNHATRPATRPTHSATSAPSNLTPKIPRRAYGARPKDRSPPSAPHTSSCSISQSGCVSEAVCASTTSTTAGAAPSSAAAWLVPSFPSCVALLVLSDAVVVALNGALNMALRIRLRCLSPTQMGKTATL
eukprot:844162-Rhodomonas_salina.4